MTDQPDKKQEQLAIKALWENRIVGYGDEPTDQIMANPNNFRIHPTIQQDALTGSLETLGWIDDVIINKRTGNLIDGHLRVILAMRNDIPFVPAKYVDLSPEEEAQALLMLDPIAALAATDADKLVNLMGIVKTDNQLVNQFMEDMAERESLFLGIPDLAQDERDTTGQKDMLIRVYVEDMEQWEDIVAGIRLTLAENNWRARIEA